MVERHGLAEEFERLLDKHKEERYVLKLYVTGMTHRSTEAVATIREICNQLLPGRFELEIVDLYQTPATARRQQIVAAPTLINEEPAPVRRLIGNLSDRERVLRALDLPVPGKAGESS